MALRLAPPYVRAKQEVSRMARFVIVVDTQGDFMHADGALAVAGAQALAGPMQAWLAALDPKETAGVLFTFDTHEPDVYACSPEAEQFPIHCVRGSAGWRNVLDMAAIDPAIPIWRLEKGVFAMWEQPGLLLHDARRPEGPGTDRDAFFEDLKAQGIVAMTVIGVAADYCVKWAIDGLVERGFTVDVPRPLTRGIERQIDAVVDQCFAGAAVSVTEPA
jgi:nicotinamidase/pyrazinamidase